MMHVSAWVHLRCVCDEVVQIKELEVAIACLEQGSIGKSRALNEALKIRRQ